MKYTVYVPSPTALLGFTLQNVLPGSGIVGEPDDYRLGGLADHVSIHFEGNKHDAVNMRRYAERVFHAAGRRKEKYPTIAKAVVCADELEAIGEIDVETWELTIWNEPALAEWLGLAPGAPVPESEKVVRWTSPAF